MIDSHQQAIDLIHRFVDRMTFDDIAACPELVKEADLFLSSESESILYRVELEARNCISSGALWPSSVLCNMIASIGDTTCPIMGNSVAILQAASQWVNAVYSGGSIPVTKRTMQRKRAALAEILERKS